MGCNYFLCEKITRHLGKEHTIEGYRQVAHFGRNRNVDILEVSRYFVNLMEKLSEDPDIDLEWKDDHRYFSRLTHLGDGYRGHNLQEREIEEEHKINPEEYRDLGARLISFVERFDMLEFQDEYDEKVDFKEHLKNITEVSKEGTIGHITYLGGISCAHYTNFR